MSLQERFRDLEKKKSDHQAAEHRKWEETKERYRRAEAILCPIVDEVCHEFAAALGFWIEQKAYRYGLLNWRKRKISGSYKIRFTSGAGSWYAIHVYTTRHIEIRVNVVYGDGSGTNSGIPWYLTKSHFGEPPEAHRVREALATALEAAAKPYVEDGF